MRTHALADGCSSLNSLLSWWPSCQRMTFIHWRPLNYLKILRENWDAEIFNLNFFISWKMRLGRIWTQVRWTCSTPRRRWWWCWRPWQQQQWWQWRNNYENVNYGNRQVAKCCIGKNSWHRFFLSFQQAAILFVSWFLEVNNQRLTDG